MDGTVDEAMAELIGQDVNRIRQCYRQGDLLFCPAHIPDNIEFSWADEWDIRESHTLTGDFERNGRYFRSPRSIAVEHTSHETVVLPPGEYRLHTLQVGAD